MNNDNNSNPCLLRTWIIHMSVAFAHSLHLSPETTTCITHCLESTPVLSILSIFIVLIDNCLSLVTLLY